MAEFLRMKREAVDQEKETQMEEENIEEEDEEKEEELLPLPNILSMISSKMKTGLPEKPKETKSNLPDLVSEPTIKPVVSRNNSFKEPDAPPNSVERTEERNLLDYDDDFLTSTGDTEDIELF